MGVQYERLVLMITYFYFLILNIFVQRLGGDAEMPEAGARYLYTVELHDAGGAASKEDLVRSGLRRHQIVDPPLKLLGALRKFEISFCHFIFQLFVTTLFADVAVLF